MKKVLLLISALALSGTMNAQSDKRDAVVNVEKGYKPIELEVGKKNFTPSTDRNIQVQPSTVEYSKEGIVYKGFTSDMNLKDALPRQERMFPGYARLGYGVTNDIDAKLAYRFGVGKNGAMNVYTALDGFKCNIGPEENKWNSRFYNNSTGLGYTHSFKRLNINADAKFSNNVFNYHCTDTASALTNKQNSRNYMVTFGGISKLSGPFSYNFKANYEYTARSYTAGVKNGIGENHFGFGGNISYNIHESKRWKEINEKYNNYNLYGPIISLISLDMRFEGFMYNPTLRNGYKGYEDYFSIDFDPRVTLTLGSWNVNVGLNMNFVTKGAMVCAVAPNISTEKNLHKNVTVYGSITGGREHNNLSRLEKLTPYWGIADSTATRLKPSYKVVDINIGSRLTFKNFSADIHAGYAYTMDDMLQVFNPAIADSVSMIYTDLKQANTHNTHVAARLGYNIRSWVRLAADVRYDHWSCDNKDLLIMKPEFTANIVAEGRIDHINKIEFITLQLGYNYTRYTKGETVERITDKHDLFARVSCQITNKFGAYIQGNNLLNNKHYEYAGYLTRGIRGEIGATLNF